jgi:hypothetical protein
MCITEAWKKQNVKDERATLFKELVIDETKCNSCFRMSQYSFSVLYKIEDGIKKKTLLKSTEC